jgi:putative addiction module component (TIGR02574 family)
MTPTLDKLGIAQMSVEDRLELVQQIWDSIAAEMEKQALTAAQRAELERRVAAADANPEESVPWEVVRAEAQARWKR